MEDESGKILSPECTQIHVDNFKESLRLYRRCTAWSIASAFTVLVFIHKDVTADGPHPGIFVLFTEVSFTAAFLIASVITILLGCYAAYVLFHAQMAGKALAHRADILGALSTFPSVATGDSRPLRIAGLIIPCGLISVAALIAAKDTVSQQGWGDLPVTLLPFIFMITPFGHMIEKTKRPLLVRNS